MRTMKKLSRLMFAILALSVAATAVQAHHSFTMFDRTREEVMDGEVVRWAFNSPHVLIYVRDAEGTVWGFEGSAPPNLLSRTPPMDGFTFQPGNEVTMIYCPLHDGRPGGAIGFIVTDDSTWYGPSDGGCGPDEDDWRGWLAAGYTSKAQAEAASE